MCGLVSQRLTNQPTSFDNFFKVSPRFTTNSVLWSRIGDAGSEEYNGSIDPLILEASLSLKKFSWISWWTQMILTTISSVTLIFAKTVISTGAPSSSATGGLSSRSGGGGFFLAGAGVTLSFLSILWTWGEARLSRRLRRRQGSYRITAAALARRAITVGTTINLLGMGSTIIGALQIIGVLTAKALSFSNTLNLNGVAGSVQSLQPLDILVVQANTNTMLSHFCSLTLMLYWGQKWILKLDPPSDPSIERENGEIGRKRDGNESKSRKRR